MVSDNKEFLSDSENIRCIIRKMCSMDLSELREYNGRDTDRIDAITREIFDVEGISPCKTDHMEYMELICLIRNVYFSRLYSGKYLRGPEALYRQHEKYYYLIELLIAYLLEARDSSTTVRLYMLITVKNLYKELEAMSSTEDLGEEYKKVQRDIEKALLILTPAKSDVQWDDATIGDVITACYGAARSSWIPTVLNLVSYQSALCTALRTAGSILIGCFATAFPDRFNMLGIKEKYKNEYLLTDEEIWDLMDWP